MTISTTTTRITYSGDGSTIAFAVPFTFFDPDELEVIEKVTATKVESVKTLTTHYTVAGGSGSTGTISAIVAPSSAVTWTIRRITHRTQLTDYTPNDPFPAETHERALDRLQAQMQEIGDDIDRSQKLSAATALSGLKPLPDPIAGQFLRGNAANDGFENASISGSGLIGIPVSVAQGGTNALTTAGALATLGALAKAGDSMAGALLLKEAGDLASATTVNLASATGNVVEITGGGTISSLGNPQDGSFFLLYFSGAATLDHAAAVSQPINLLSSGDETVVPGSWKQFVKREGSWFEVGGGSGGPGEDLLLFQSFI